MLQKKCPQVIFLFYISLTFGNGLEYLKYFLKVENALLKDSKTLMTLDVDAFNCSERCFETSVCKSFVSRTMSPRCILYEDDSTEKILIKATNTHFYQLRRSVPTKFRDGKCPLDIVDNAFLPGNNDIETSVLSYTMCFYRCEEKPNCQSFDYGISDRRCILSSKNHNDSVAWYGAQTLYTEISRELWNDFNQSHTLEDINAAGCAFGSYFILDKKEINGQTTYSTFSFKPNSHHNLVIEAQVDARSVLDCSRLCMLSSTCTAFSYTNTKCLLKKLI
ncbi:uncharacterized protein LOC106868906 [Octopus bimaculoides]|uniref:Apple domain-containing protein n=1 Tax=Octopus bimaculoides TaxID=37653 RepID=A0A0L8HS26_OCTBM|nr:uncharacterized protein LOC106868906 [Octopus bimaculoides]|eukprot:XP_014769852.1 PREDICTED: uncharacterized protein LOC106868906 [Octopus bimaculoides]